MADSQSELVGVVGSPIGHSLSPVLHESAFRALGLPWQSRRFEVGEGRGADVVVAMRTLGIRGLSVTMPLKGEIAAAVDRLDGIAAMLGSVNCLAWEGEEIVGLSTDGEGLLASLQRTAEFSVPGSRVVIAGSGGAARSVAAAFGLYGAAEVTVVARNFEHASQVAALAGDVGRVGEMTDAAVADLVVDATPVGMTSTGSAHAAALIEPTLLHAGQVCVDLVYNPRMTPWLMAAREHGAFVVDGLGMLVHQAALQIERWTGEVAPTEAMWDAVSREKS